MKRKPLLALVTGIALVFAALLLYPSRQTDERFSHAVSAEGNEVFEFGSPMAPALPEDIRQADDLAGLLERLGLQGFAGEIAVNPPEGGGFRWRDGRGWEIRVFAKQCDDGLACVDRVEIRPDGETRLRNIDAADARARLVSAADYEAWPFTVAMAVIRCQPPSAVTLRTPDGLYALNGQGRTENTLEVDAILREHPQRPGARMPYGPVFFDAMALCD
ncbi:DUF2511 domain-containing protein [Marinobacterium aestuariivivens]|uniref:DUF2511 domain-containing protein n=1 Tax=Marinobacterium aestuariivivens TaxID=1698799 RepID=A0ABW2A6G4_9GAMM